MDALTARRAALTAERQKARREEQDYAAVRRNVKEFLSPLRQAAAGGGALGGGIALFLLNFVFAGLIGGCVLVWRLLVAAWYVPLTLYRLLTAGCACIITED